MNERIRTVLLITLSTLVLIWPLIWNGFPFVYWDTAGYLTRFEDHALALVHPVYYSIWLAAFRILPEGLFIAAIAQAAITATLSYLLCLSVSERPFLLFGICILSLAISPTAFHVVTLMPDVATVWMALTMPLLITRFRLIAIITIALSLSFHYSHLPIFLTATCLLILHQKLVKERLKPLLIAVAILMFWQLSAICINNLLVGTSALESPTVFMIAGRMNQSDALHLSLAEAGDYEWSEQVKFLIREPESLLWSSASPVTINYPHWAEDYGQYEQAKARLQPAVKLALSNHWRSFLFTGKHNVTSMIRGEYIFQGFAQHDDSIVAAVNSNAFRTSRQQTGRFLLSESYISTWRFLFYWLSLLTVPLVPLALLRKDLIVPAIIATCFVANILVCGLFASIATRYIEKVIALTLIAFALGLARLRVQSQSPELLRSEI